jgi:hypothetical protein
MTDQTRPTPADTRARLRAELDARFDTSDPPDPDGPDLSSDTRDRDECGMTADELEEAVGPPCPVCENPADHDPFDIEACPGVVFDSGPRITYDMIDRLTALAPEVTRLIETTALAINSVESSIRTTAEEIGRDLYRVRERLEVGLGMNDRGELGSRPVELDRLISLRHFHWQTMTALVGPIVSAKLALRNAPVSTFDELMTRNYEAAKGESR